MTESRPLSEQELDWLMKIHREPITHAVATAAVPEAIRDSLLEKQLVEWRVGYLEVSLLETTARGAEAAARAAKNRQ